MTQTTMRGVYPILVTPFDDKGRIDTESLERLVEANIEWGVHGIGIALGSEVFKFSEAERELVTRTVVRQVRGRVPVVMNTGANGTELAIHYSLAAQEHGADALMIMPPSFAPVGAAETREYFKAISDAVKLPIFIQDTSNPHVAAGLCRQIAEESEHVRYVKVESLPTPVMVADAIATCGGLPTIFGGAGGNYFIEEMRRGSVGTMPSCSQSDAFVKVWDLFQAGDQAGAEKVFYDLIVPMNRLSGQTWGAFYHVNKELLRQRGVIACAHVRGPIAPLDALTRREMDEMIERLYGKKQ